MFKVPSITPKSGLIVAGAALGAYLLFKHIKKDDIPPVMVATPPSSTPPKSSEGNLRISNAYLAGRISAFEATTTTTSTTTTPTAEDNLVVSIKKSIKDGIIVRAQNPTTTISNLQTIETEINTYDSQIRLLAKHKLAGTLTPEQYSNYIFDIMKAVMTKLKIAIKPGALTHRDNKVPTPMAPGVPSYYQDYYKKYLEYIKSLQNNYYNYYQPSYQYYPGQQYGYYQPYQYSYPNPYQQAGQYQYSYPNYSQMGMYNQYPGYQPYTPQYGMGGYPSMGGSAGINIDFGNNSGFSFF